MALSLAFVQNLDKRVKFRRTVERCARLGVEITHNGFIWLLEGGPAAVSFGALDLSTVTAADLAPTRRKTNGNR